MRAESPVALAVTFTILHVVVIAIFTHGFLLTRVELPNVSTCGPQGCSTQRYRKAVILIVDALRHDFVCPPAGPRKPHHGLLPKTLQRVEQADGAATALRFVADTPTITMSRLKALLTGGLPTFLDVGKSFSASRLSEDNLLSQALAAGRRMVFMGDDTWMQLAPDVWSWAAPFPSFNVRDLHTVDNGVWQHLLPALGDPWSWDLLVAHWLGVDHAGHAHGVGSEAMHAKLAQMDDQLSHVIDLLAEGGHQGGPYADTLLLIFGDHGQTLGGDHGGGSADETDSVLIAADVGRLSAALHRRGAGAPQQAPPPAERAESGAGGGVGGREGLSGGDAGFLDAHLLQGSCALGSTCQQTIPQVDLTPTIALLLGLPIPYGNIGKVPAQLWAPLSRVSGAQPAGAWLRSYEDALAATADQVHAYLRSYAAAASLPPRPLAECGALHLAAAALRAGGGGDGAAEHAGEAGDAVRARASVDAHLRFLEAAAALTRAQFTQFHGGFIWAGCAAAVATLAWQVWLCWRLLADGISAADRGASSAAGAGLFATALAAAAARPEAAACVVLAAGHAASLFSVGALMGEGRLLCYEVAALTLLTGRTALRAALAARGHARRAGACRLCRAAGADAATAPAVVTAVVEPMGSKAAPRRGAIPTNNLQHPFNPPASAGAGAGPCEWDGRCSVAGNAPAALAAVPAPVGVPAVVACTAALLAMQWGLAALGLIDRSGQDPHDKTEPSAELLAGAAGGSAATARTLAATIVPLAALLALLWTADRWLLRHLDAALQQERRSSSTSSSSGSALAGAGAGAQPGMRLARTARAAAVAALATTAAWWAVQLLGFGDATSAGLLSVAWGMSGIGFRAPLEGLLPLTGGAWRVEGAALLVGASEAVGHTPLRLLLPRVVYALAAAVLGVFGTGVAAATARSAAAFVAARVRTGNAPAAVVAPLPRTPQLVAAGRALLWLLACLAAPVAVVLGFRGPAFVCLGFAQGMALVALFAAETVAQRGLPFAGAPQPTAHPGGASGDAAPCQAAAPSCSSGSAAADADAAPPPRFPLGVASGVWSLLAMQLFFCSGHFCEFSGLQYTASFIGFDEVEWTAASLLLATNTFGLPALQLLALPLVCVAAALVDDGRGGHAAAAVAARPPRLALSTAIAVASAVRFAALGVSVVSAAVQVRHILLWAIFAPKLVFEVALGGVADAVLLFGAALLEWLLRRGI